MIMKARKEEGNKTVNTQFPPHYKVDMVMTARRKEGSRTVNTDSPAHYTLCDNCSKKAGDVSKSYVRAIITAKIGH